jgi:hypothetical protein
MSAQLTYEAPQATTTENATANGQGRRHGAWHRVREAVRDMNYAGQRITLLRDPWAAADSRRSR